MKIALASDHGGYLFKSQLIEWLESNGADFEDFGTNSEESCDYPDFGIPAANVLVP